MNDLATSTDAWSEGMVGAFIMFQPWSRFAARSENRRPFGQLVDAGVDTVFIESDHCDRELIAGAHRVGLKVVAVVCCYGKSKLATDWYQKRPDLRPVDAMGRIWGDAGPPAMPPTCSEYNDALYREVRTCLSRTDVDGVLLDFIRWPLHWEKALRGSWAQAITSFDDTSVSAFSDHACLAVKPRSPSERALWIRSRYPDRWAKFRKEVVRRQVERLSEIAKTARGTRFPVGATLVPASEAAVGQGVDAMLAHVDYLFPMVYHAILRKPLGWVVRFLDASYRDSKDRVVPIIQVETDDARAGGVDWGPTVSSTEWQALLDETVRWKASSPSLAVFDASGLLTGDRDARLRRALEKEREDGV